MRVRELELTGVYLLDPLVHIDTRGFFMESYNTKTLQQLGLNCSFLQDNLSYSIEVGTIRGLHYQLNPKAQTKLVTVVTGAILDVVVDIRKSSSTFGHWIGEVLSEENKRQLLIPKGFAHGFCTIQPHTRVLYKVDEYYSPQYDRGILWCDASLGIEWPTSHPILSDKDEKLPLFKGADLNFE